MTFAHLVEIDEEARTLHVYRIWETGIEKQLFTSVDLPTQSFDENKEGFHRFAAMLGENLLLDSPTARKLFKLD
jgi:hypothetical protein